MGGCAVNKLSFTPISHNIKPLVDKMKITDHLAAVHYSAGKPRLLTFMRMPANINHPPKHPCRPKTPLAPVHPDDIGPSAGRYELPQTAQKQPGEHDEESRPGFEMPQVHIWLSNMGHVYKITIYGWFQGGLLCLKQCFDGVYGSKNIRLNTNRMLHCSHLTSFTSSAGGFNVKADGCKPQNQELQIKPLHFKSFTWTKVQVNRRQINMILDAGTSDQEQVLFRSMKSAFSPDVWRVSEKPHTKYTVFMCIL